jgi:hypothetical protein
VSCCGGSVRLCCPFRRGTLGGIHERRLPRRLQCRAVGWQGSHGVLRPGASREVIDEAREARFGT